MKISSIVKKNREMVPVQTQKPVLGEVTRGVGKEELITRSTADRHMAFVGIRVPRGSIIKKVVGSKIPKLTHEGFLLIHGDKPGLLVRTVRHDAAKEFYVYQNGAKPAYGKVSALNSTDNKKFHAEIVGPLEVLKRAKKFGKCVQAKNVGSKKIVVVFLLNSMGDKYIAGVTKANGRVVVVNMEHPSQFNQPKDQYVDFKDKEESFDAFFKGVK